MIDRIPSPEEFHSAISEGFNFLCQLYGFRKGLSESNLFEAIYTRARGTIRVLGGGYGSMAWMEISLDGRDVPYHLLLTSRRIRYFLASDSPQLDDIREIAARLQRECSGFLTDPVRFSEDAWQAERDAADAAQRRRDADPKGTFFSHADALWKNKKWHELASHLASSVYPLSSAWAERLDQAHSHTRHDH